MIPKHCKRQKSLINLKKANLFRNKKHFKDTLKVLIKKTKQNNNIYHMLNNKEKLIKNICFNEEHFLNKIHTQGRVFMCLNKLQKNFNNDENLIYYSVKPFLNNNSFKSKDDIDIPRNKSFYKLCDLKSINNKSPFDFNFNSPIIKKPKKTKPPKLKLKILKKKSFNVKHFNKNEKSIELREQNIHYENKIKMIQTKFKTSLKMKNVEKINIDDLFGYKKSLSKKNVKEINENILNKNIISYSLTNPFDNIFKTSDKNKNVSIDNLLNKNQLNPSFNLLNSKIIMNNPISKESSQNDFCNKMFSKISDNHSSSNDLENMKFNILS